MNNNTKFKIYLPSVFVVLLFHASFISFPYWDGYYTFKYAIIFVVGCFLFFNMKIILNKRFFKINIILLCYISFILFSSYINKDYIISRNTFLAAVIFSSVVVEIFFLFEYFYIKNKTNKLISIIYYLTLFYVVITDLLLIIKPTLYIEKGMYYLIGNKFVVSYLHLQLITLFLQKAKLNRNDNIKVKIYMILYIILTLFICIQVECSTGIVGLIVLVLMTIFEKNLKVIIKNPKIVLVILFFSTMILFLFSSILDNKIVSYFIVDVLKEDITLTGRTIIYENISYVLQDHLLLGYGYGSSFEVMMSLMRFPNTQNGLLEVILQNGIIAALMLIMLIYFIFRDIKKSSTNFYSVIIVYIYILLASIEVTLDISFLTWLALTLICDTSKIDNISV